MPTMNKVGKTSHPAAQSQNASQLETKPCYTDGEDITEQLNVHTKKQFAELAKRRDT